MAMQMASDMDIGDLEAEIESLEDYMRECAEIGQGVNSKETVRLRMLRGELTRRNSDSGGHPAVL